MRKGMSRSEIRKHEQDEAYNGDKIGQYPSKEIGSGFGALQMLERGEKREQQATFARSS
jgi:hypothetical protein